MTHRPSTRVKVLTLLTILSGAPGAVAQGVPGLVNYQGRLTGASGAPLATADYELTFRIYDDPTAGSRVWGPQVFDGAVIPGHGAKVPVVLGHFNVVLGPSDIHGNPLAGSFGASPRFLEVQVGSNPAIAPRQQILSAPFAIRAGDADTLAGGKLKWDGEFQLTGKLNADEVRVHGRTTCLDVLASDTITSQVRLIAPDIAISGQGLRCLVRNSVPGQTGHTVCHVQDEECVMTWFAPEHGGNGVQYCGTVIGDDRWRHTCCRLRP